MTVEPADWEDQLRGHRTWLPTSFQCDAFSNRTLLRGGLLTVLTIWDRDHCPLMFRSLKSVTHGQCQTYGYLPSRRALPPLTGSKL